MHAKKRSWTTARGPSRRRVYRSDRAGGASVSSGRLRPPGGGATFLTMWSKSSRSGIAISWPAGVVCLGSSRCGVSVIRSGWRGRPTGDLVKWAAAFASEHDVAHSVERREVVVGVRSCRVMPVNDPLVGTDALCEYVSAVAAEERRRSIAPLDRRGACVCGGQDFSRSLTRLWNDPHRSLRHARHAGKHAYTVAAHM